METSALSWHWYVLHTRSRFESVVQESLHKKNHEVFLPKVRVRSKRRDRRVTLDAPLFPGYLFVRSNLHPHHHLDILKTVGAVKLIGNQQSPVPVSDETVASLKIMVHQTSEIVTGSRFRKGDRVLVIAGIFAGIVGIFTRYRGIGRVVVNVELLGQFASVEVDEDDVEVIPPQVQQLYSPQR